MVDGSTLTIAGNHIKSYKKSNTTGVQKTNEFSLSLSPSDSENHISTHLLKAGYTRKIISNETGHLKIHYSKQGNTVIGATFAAQNS
ncbi:hypothetical protein [Pseudomonas fontis]|uniref:Uncharacterized protein n=1 Tax=Pseudomonas fontis TaxID=2942633 RepID=A0ABT5NUU0_9PSED|nr:hypothetical protein [Pseudomonas fontis]MDD0977170.1 hypothetical protein [Pseudomonas fontis]MDD0991945.1 hypothetical protein [Pseudomonas fontis]